MTKASQKLFWKFKKESSQGKLSRKALPINWILSYLYTFQNDLQALSWAFVLGGIGLKEALVDCSWRLKKNRSEPIEPVLKLAKVGPNVRAKVRGLTLTLTFHISKPHSSGLDVGANVRGLTLTLTLASLMHIYGANFVLLSCCQFYAHYRLLYMVGKLWMSSF